MKKIIVGIVCVLLLSGCYTQFATYNTLYGNPSVPPDSLLASDSGKGRILDTVKLNDRQVCYWTRNVWGQPELRCDESYYGRDWYSYNNYPWWQKSSSYYYGDYNYDGFYEQCPAFYFYDYSCGACRYYADDRNHVGLWWWNGGNERGGRSGRSYGGGSSYSTSSTSSSSSHRSLSYGIPNASDVKKTQSQQSVAKSATGNSNISNQHGVINQRSLNQGIPNSTEVRPAERIELPSAVEMTSQPQPQVQPSQSAPPTTPPSSPPPSSTNSSQENTSGGNQSAHHNTRGW